MPRASRRTLTRARKPETARSPARPAPACAAAAAGSAASAQAIRAREGRRHRDTMASVLLVHLLAQAEGSHVGPDLLDVRETIGLRAALAGVAPSGRILTVG